MIKRLINDHRFYLDHKDKIEDTDYINYRNSFIIYKSFILLSLVVLMPIWAIAFIFEFLSEAIFKFLNVVGYVTNITKMIDKHEDIVYTLNKKIKQDIKR